MSKVLVMQQQHRDERSDDIDVVAQEEELARLGTLMDEAIDRLKASKKDKDWDVFFSVCDSAKKLCKDNIEVEKYGV